MPSRPLHCGSVGLPGLPMPARPPEASSEKEWLRRDALSSLWRKKLTVDEAPLRRLSVLCCRVTMLCPKCLKRCESSLCWLGSVGLSTWDCQSCSSLRRLLARLARLLCCDDCWLSAYSRDWVSNFLDSVLDGALRHGHSQPSRIMQLNQQASS